MFYLLLHSNKQFYVHLIALYLPNAPLLAFLSSTVKFPSPVLTDSSKLQLSSSSSETRSMLLIRFPFSSFMLALASSQSSASAHQSVTVVLEATEGDSSGSFIFS